MTLERDNGDIAFVDVVRDGAKYRIERRDQTHASSANAAAPLTIAVSFDGERFLSLNGRTGELLYTSSAGAPISFDVCLAPYGWLMYGMGTSPSWENLRSQSHWSDRFSSAKYVGQERWGSFECEVLEFPHLTSTQGSYYRVFFAQEQGMFPVRSERILENGQLGSECSVDALKAFDADGVQGVVALTVRYRQTGIGRGTRMSWVMRTNPDTLKLNTSVDPAEFNISPLRANAVYDLVSFPPPVASELQSGAVSGWRAVLVLVNIIVVALLICFIIKARTRRQTLNAER